MKPILFDLFCGAGLAAKGYKDAGFYVVGFDIAYQKRYAGDEFYRIDVRELRPQHLVGAAAIHASPCCQFASQITPDKSKHENFIPFTRDLLQRSGLPYVIENVEGARAHLRNPVTLCGRDFGLKVYRHRLFESSFPINSIEHAPHRDNTPRAGHGGSDKGFTSVTSGGESLTSKKGFISVSGHISGTDYCRTAMGVGWYVSAAELTEGIPPVKAQYAGLHLMAHLTGDSGYIDEAFKLLQVPHSKPMFVEAGA